MAFTNNPKVIPSGSGKAGWIASFAEAASQSFKKGEFVYLSSGALTACASDATKILGIALEDASGTTGTSIKVQVIEPNDIIKIRVRNDTTDATCDNASLGTSYGTIVASNVHYLDINDTTNDALVPVRYETDESGSYTYWIYARVLPSVLQSATGA